MLINGSPVNGLMLNGSRRPSSQIIIVGPGQGGSTPPPNPGEIAWPAASAYTWTARVTLGGVDVSARLIGVITVDREEGAAGIADFALFYPPGEPVPVDIASRAVTIDLISTTAGETTQTRRFTGLVAEPSWNALSRTLAVACTDNLQQRVEALSIEQIDALVGGQWSADVFDALEGRSHWDYALERLESLPASLDCSPAGALRLTSWYAAQSAHYVFGPGTTLYESIGVELAQLASITNRVELEIAYRYSRFREYRQNYSWSHPGTQGLSGIGGFCAWRSDSTELPDIGDVIDSVADGGQVAVSANYYRLPGTMPNPCGDGVPWINNQAGLLLGASWVGATRWVQTVTETYNLTLTTATGQIEGRQVISRDGTSVEIEAPEGWEDSLSPIDPEASGDQAAGEAAPGLGEPGDRDDEVRRSAALGLLLERARVEIISAHRQTSVTWSVPTPMALDVDLVHTLEIDDQYVRARGKCSRVFDTLDIDSGSCITDLTISVMRGGGESDPLAIPARPGALAGSGGSGGAGSGGSLPTQLGGKLTGDPYDDEMLGFSGNYSISQDATLEVFPRRLDIEAAEIPAADRDEHTATAAATYRVGVPNDLLEL